MIKIIFNILVLFNFSFIIISAQNFIHFNANQPEKIRALAGDTIKIVSGEKIQIGKNPSASEGYPPYKYEWTPSLYLDYTNISNPYASPLSSILYTLVVTDHNGCTNSDIVYVNTIDTGSIIMNDYFKDVFFIYNSKTQIISILPNPQSIQYIHITIQNIRGITIYAKEIKSDTKINISEYYPGIYIISLKYLDSIKSFKIFKY